MYKTCVETEANWIDKKAMKKLQQRIRRGSNSLTFLSSSLFHLVLSSSGNRGLYN